MYFTPLNQWYNKFNRKGVTMRLKESFTHTLDIEKSEFICYVDRAFSEQEARDFIMEIRKKHRDATHCCTAFIIGENNEIMRSNDDGEPSGTAGAPMLDALHKSSIHNCVAVVVRYFGGIKLGAGGLIRAYSKSVSEALRLAPKVETVLMNRYTCDFDYDWVNKCDFFMKDTCDILEKKYDVVVSYTFQTKDLEFHYKLIEFSNGQLQPQLLEQSLVERSCD